MSVISFGSQQKEFTIALNKRVNEYFASNKMKHTGNFRLYSKTIILFIASIAIYVASVFFTPAWYFLLPMAILFGFALASIGFNVMHDGAHGSYSQKPWLNELMGLTLNAMGGSVYFWKIKHNLAHHNFTNIDEHDDDIDIRPFMRTSVHQKKYWFHKYQHWYWFPLYSLMYYFWVFDSDFVKYFSGKVAQTKIKKMNLKEHVIFWMTKIYYLFFFVALPLYTMGLGNFLLFYLVSHFTCGIILSIVFQLAHVVEQADFYHIKEEKGQMPHDWTVHQLHTTANFATNNKLISWYVGGLNFQVEHHLFPRISHIHYPAINKIVKDVCKEFQVRYNEYPGLYSALRSHILYLKAVGNA